MSASSRLSPRWSGAGRPALGPPGSVTGIHSLTPPVGTAGLAVAAAEKEKAKGIQDGSLFAFVRWGRGRCRVESPLFFTPGPACQRQLRTGRHSRVGRRAASGSGIQWGATRGDGNWDPLRFEFCGRKGPDRQAPAFVLCTCTRPLLARRVVKECGLRCTTYYTMCPSLCAGLGAGAGAATAAMEWRSSKGRWDSPPVGWGMEGGRDALLSADKRPSYGLR